VPLLAPLNRMSRRRRDLAASIALPNMWYAMANNSERILQMDQSAQRPLSNARRYLNLEVRRDHRGFCDIAGKLEINHDG